MSKETFLVWNFPTRVVFPGGAEEIAAFIQKYEGRVSVDAHSNYTRMHAWDDEMEKQLKFYMTEHFPHVRARVCDASNINADAFVAY